MDIKPSNLVWGDFITQSINEFKDNILLINFDLERLYRNNENEYIPLEEEINNIGNTMFKNH